MKQIIIYIIPVILAFTTISCQKDVLKEEYQVELTYKDGGDEKDSESKSKEEKLIIFTVSYIFDDYLYLMKKDCVFPLNLKLSKKKRDGSFLIEISTEWDVVYTIRSEEQILDLIDNKEVIFFFEKESKGIECASSNPIEKRIGVRHLLSPRKTGVIHQIQKYYDGNEVYGISKVNGIKEFNWPKTR